MEAESRRRKRCDNKDTCSFAQDLCVKFDVTFTVNAEIEDGSVDVECDG